MSVSMIAADLGLLVRGRPHGQRVARNDIDVALAAAALDMKLDIYFLGDAVLQLAAEQNPEGALLPAGYRAWASLPELGQVRFFAEQAWLEKCENRKIELSIPVEGLSANDLRTAWRVCRRTMVL